MYGVKMCITVLSVRDISNSITKDCFISESTSVIIDKGDNDIFSI